MSVAAPQGWVCGKEAAHDHGELDVELSDVGMVVVSNGDPDSRAHQGMPDQGDSQHRRAPLTPTRLAVVKEPPERCQSPLLI